MRLLFEWIKCDEHNIFSNCGVNFTSDYDISYDSKNNILSIKKVESPVPKNFYSLNGSIVVSQVNCIVGKNGSGKTTLLKHIYNTDISEARYTHWNTIQVMEYGDEIRIYHNQPSINVEGDFPEYKFDNKNRVVVKEVIEDGDYAHTTKIFITNDPYGWVNSNLTSFGFQNKIAFTPYDISVLQSGFLRLISDIQNGPLFLHNSPYKFNQYLQQHSNRQFFQNILYCFLIKTIRDNNLKSRFKYLKNIRIIFQRICESDAYIDVYGLYQFIINRFSLEKIINNKVDKNEVEQFAIEQRMNLDFDLLKFCALHNLAVKNYSINNKSIYTNLKLNLITELLISLSDFNEDICKLDGYDVETLLKILESQIEASYVDIDANVLEVKKLELRYLRSANQAIERLKECVPSVCTNESLLLDNTPEFLDYFYEEIKSKQSFVLKYFWLNYTCSSGERAFLNIFAYINAILNYKFISQDAIYGCNKNIILFLDEPDMSCHPEWQRKMLREMIETFEMLYNGYSVHIILSTHSPLFLSDIPKENVILLDEDEEGKCTVRSCDKRTFGANIFDLYNDSFFLDSFMGDFAQQKIEEAINKIARWYSNKSKATNKELQDVSLIVELIGEPILRNKLATMLKQIKERN